MNDDLMKQSWVMYGLPRSPYASPIRNQADLPPLTVDVHQRPPEGLLAAWVGPAYGPEHLRDLAQHHQGDMPWKIHLRAFPIPRLMPLTVEAPHPLAVMEALLTALTSSIPGVVWGVAPDSYIYPLLGALHKYGLVRTMIPAPPDLVTNQAMGLELSGKVIQMNGVPLTTPEGQQLWSQISEVPWERQDPTIYSGWLTSLTLQISQVTYANLAYPAIKVPFYL